MKDYGKVADEKLVELVREKDQELYRELVRRYQDKLWRYAGWLVKNEDQAADIVQEAFIKAFVNLKGFDTKKKFSSWIYRIVHNLAINELKKDKKKISLESNLWLGNLANDEPAMVDTLARKEVQLLVKKSLKKLPLKYREPLALFYLEEKNYEEISDILRIPTGTVGTRINRAKKIMKQIIVKKEKG